MLKLNDRVRSKYFSGLAVVRALLPGDTAIIELPATKANIVIQCHHLTKDDSSTMGVYLLSLILIPGVITLDGWVVLTLWHWFVQSLFVGVPVLGLGAACGLSLFVGFVTGQYVPMERDDYERAVNQLAWNLSRPLMVLAIGWVIHSFMR